MKVDFIVQKDWTPPRFKHPPNWGGPKIGSLKRFFCKVRCSQGKFLGNTEPCDCCVLGTKSQKKWPYNIYVITHFFFLNPPIRSWGGGHFGKNGWGGVISVNTSFYIIFASKILRFFTFYVLRKYYSYFHITVYEN